MAACDALGALLYALYDARHAAQRQNRPPFATVRP